jgi:enoyl-CoA hydratase/carnithine racemase
MIARIDTSERDRVVYLRVSSPTRPHDLAPLAWELLDTCQALEEREAPLVAVALVAGPGPFWVEPVTSAADCDAAAGPWSDATRALGRLNTPTLACVGGDAIGPAWDLALACDLRLVASEAHVGSPEIRWGRMPSAGATQRLTRLAGQPTALRLLLLGQLVAAPLLVDMGLAVSSPPGTELGRELERVLNELRRSAPIALAYAREAVHHAVELRLEDGLRLEADLATLLQTTEDRMTGITGFLQRRPASFEGR